MLFTSIVDHIAKGAREPTPDMAAALSNAIDDVRTQHDIFLDSGVNAGFDVTHDSGNMSENNKEASQELVPQAARCAREKALLDELRVTFGRTIGDHLYALSPYDDDYIRNKSDCDRVLSVLG